MVEEIDQGKKNIFKANQSVAFVQNELTKLNCLVRQVAEGTDFGIDLYCESISPEGTPFLHFWIQVKTGEQVKVVDEVKGEAKFNFECADLRYWAGQPVPVFVFLVPPGTGPLASSEYPFYVVSVTHKYVNKKLKFEQKYQTLYSDLAIKGIDDLKALLQEDLPVLTAKQFLAEGYVREVPFPKGPNYELKVPLGQINLHLDPILRKIRRAAALAVDEAEIFKLELNLRQKFIIRNILRAFVETGDKNSENNFALGYLAFIDSDYPTALAEFRQTINIIKADPKLIDPIWPKKIALCEKYIREIEERI